MRPVLAAHLVAIVTILGSTSAAAGAAAAVDPVQGQKLYAQHCTGCHVRLMGGDGTTIHTRKDSMIHSLSALQQRVAFCSTQINAHLFPEEEADISAWLNDKFYKFKPTK
jgi:hypothetical protein